jgi:translation initiation factor 1 (eIF-1/SUI1)
MAGIVSRCVLWCILTSRLQVDCSTGSTAEDGRSNKDRGIIAQGDTRMSNFIAEMNRS